MVRPVQKNKNKKKKKTTKRCSGYDTNLQQMVRVQFLSYAGGVGSIPGRVIPKTLKMELDTTLLNTQHYKVRFKGKVEQTWEWSSALPYTLV